MFQLAWYGLIVRHTIHRHIFPRGILSRLHASQVHRHAGVCNCTEPDTCAKKTIIPTKNITNGLYWTSSMLWVDGKQSWLSWLTHA